MRCPYCGYRESKVVDSRPADEGASIRRRRECLSCEKRFTTYETIEYLPMVVIKKDGSRQSFDRSKVLRGIQRSCEKRPVSVAEMERMVTEIEQELQNSLEREISTGTIGEKVMEKLKKADEVAYVRFASVYRQFKDINTFMSELNKLLSEKYGLQNIPQAQALQLVQQLQLLAQLRQLRQQVIPLLQPAQGPAPGQGHLGCVQGFVVDDHMEIILGPVPAVRQGVHGLPGHVPALLGRQLGDPVRLVHPPAGPAVQSRRVENAQGQQSRQHQRGDDQKPLHTSSLAWQITLPPWSRDRRNT